MSEAIPHARRGSGLPPVLTLHPCLSVAGTKYRIAFQLSVISNYSNGNPWSVVLGGTTLVSGAGSSVAWVQYQLPVTCGANAASNSLQFRLQSNTNRAARILVDNVIVTPV